MHNDGIFNAAGTSATSAQEIAVECLLKPGIGKRLAKDDDKVRKVVKDVYRTHWLHARDLVHEGKAKKDDFYVFVGYCGWVPEQLQNEITSGSWYAMAAAGHAVMEELETLRAKHLQAGNVVEDGVDTWNSMMHRIGRDVLEDDEDQGGRRRVAYDRTLADELLREWIAARLTALPTSSRIFDFRKIRAREAAVKLQLKGTETIAPGALLAGRAVGPDFLLENQCLHRSLQLIVAADDANDVFVLATLNRPTTRQVQLTSQPEDDYERRWLRSVAYGGDTANNNIVWIKLGDLPVSDSKAKALPGPAGVMDSYTPYICDGAEVAKAVGSQRCDIEEILAISGVTVFQKQELLRLLGTGALIPLDHANFPWDELFALHRHTHGHDNGLRIYNHALTLHGLDPQNPVPRDPILEAHLDDTTALADRAFTAFSPYVLAYSGLGDLPPGVSTT